MARYTGPVCRLCRREGQKLYLKGDKCYTDKCPVARRNYVPGQHGQSRKKVTEYGLQLREKQKVRRFYGIQESQMRMYFDRADKMPGITGENLLKLLELRFDNTVYRLGFASSRAEARQLVRHGHFTINGNKVDIPSTILKVGDVIEVKARSKNSPKFKELVENHRGNTVRWLEVNPEEYRGRVVAEPTREDIDIPIQEHLIVELYSK
ncbi:30S ribosomal protein S4 [Tepidimicrobium xylanilyticum]|uniref:Small ribosomal subunit protein uS4 n=1 Tax=Tepidimicrobium xylanilyticum TaxID=1123352 RepID=A0A1H2VJU7_9FIRM|nr:30S ribosomal protein S4 [Tepidimicrobium xylanilyticum]GMG97859.1 30S ribosomal protein S4 [Tepidimicrobium xylanilyticum]SDW68621.1 SSU ribosomal protein S4P [Tepidimicrobium xylanilyticum]